MLNSLVKYLEKAFQIGCKLLFDLKEIRNIKFKWTLWLPNKKKVLNLFLCLFVLLWNGRIKLDRSFYFTRFVFKPSYPLLSSAWWGYNNADRLTAQVVNALSTLSALRQEMQLPFLSSQFRPLPFRSPLPSSCSGFCRRYKKYHFTSHETMFCALSAPFLFSPKIWCFHIQFSNFFFLYFASFFHDACGKVFMAGIIVSHRQKFAVWFYIHSSESSECMCTYTRRVEGECEVCFI